MPTITPVEREVTIFLLSRPSAEQIIDFHPSPEVADRMYTLIDAERSGTLDADEYQELETFVYIEHLMRLLKAEAHLQLRQQAS